MLDRCSVPSPRVLVAHSFGGLIAVAYALRYPRELAGMVLVDPIGIEEWSKPAPLARSMLAAGFFWRAAEKCWRNLAWSDLR